MFQKIKTWAEMPDQQKLNFLIGIVIVAMSWVIYFMDTKISEVKAEKAAQRIEHVTREASMEAKLDVCQQNYLIYLQKSEREYRDLLFEARRLKRRNDGIN